MRLGVICFTAAGSKLSGCLTVGLKQAGHEVIRVNCLKGEKDLSLGEWTRMAFTECEGIVYIGACGIAVRAIAPFLRDKTVDPAVITVDEQGHFVVSLLSGHLGGANQLAVEAAAVLGATPVISTATDLHGCFAVDLWAQKQGIILDSRETAKAISARLLDGGTVGFYSDFPIDGNFPNGLYSAEAGELGICVTLNADKHPFERTLRAFPRVVTLGVGCRRGVATETFEAVLLGALSEMRLPLEAVMGLATIDLKREENCLCNFARKYDLSLSFFSADELAELSGRFSASGFVQQVTGVDNVCERAAVLASGGTLYFGKYTGQAVTVAAAVSNWRVNFGNSNGWN